jgi:hypothetical protein
LNKDEAEKMKLKLVRIIKEIHLATEKLELDKKESKHG